MPTTRPLSEPPALLSRSKLLSREDLVGLKDQAPRVGQGVPMAGGRRRPTRTSGAAGNPGPTGTKLAAHLLRRQRQESKAESCRQHQDGRGIAESRAQDQPGSLQRRNLESNSALVRNRTRRESRTS